MFLKAMVTENIPMKWRTLLKTVAKDGVFCSRVMRLELQKMLSWSHWQARWVSGFFT